MSHSENAWPNFKLRRTCQTCKFFLPLSNFTFGKCILPHGPILSETPTKELKKRLREETNTAFLKKFKNTHCGCYCDNHQWKPLRYLKKILEKLNMRLSDLE
jgi:hypothetical protein